MIQSPAYTFWRLEESQPSNKLRTKIAVQNVESLTHTIQENSSDTAARMTYSGFATWPSATLTKTVELLPKLFLCRGILQSIFEVKQHTFWNTTLQTVAFEEPFHKSRAAGLGQRGDPRSEAVQLSHCQESPLFKSQSLSGLSDITALLFWHIQTRNVSRWTPPLSLYW